MSRNPNIEEAHDAGKNGWPSPKQASRHNYTDAEQRAWTAGMTERCRQQYRDLQTSE